MMFKLSFAVRCRCLLLKKSMVTGLWMMDPQQISLSTTSMSTTTIAVSPVPLEEITCIESYSRVSRIYSLVLYWTQIIILLLPPLLYCLPLLIYFTARLLTKSFLVRVRLSYMESKLLSKRFLCVLLSSKKWHVTFWFIYLFCYIRVLAKWVHMQHPCIILQCHVMLGCEDCLNKVPRPTTGRVNYCKLL